MQRLLAGLALAVVAAGCARTEALLVVSTDGLAVPDDLEKLRLVVSNGGFEGDVPICKGGQVSTDALPCYSFPIRILLVPGSDVAQDAQVNVYGVKQNTDVLGSAVRFRFARDQRLRIDMILYADCLNKLSCVEMNQACVRAGQCADLVPTEYQPNPDLPAPVPPSDLATTPPDFSGVDFAGCVPSCASNAQCGFSCGQPCGAGCGGRSSCNAVTMQCDPCGLVGQPCCAGQCASGTSYCDTTNVCQPVDMATDDFGMTMTNDLSSMGGYDFSSSDFGDMTSCGYLTERCCSSNLCFQGVCYTGFCVNLGGMDFATTFDASAPVSDM